MLNDCSRSLVLAALFVVPSVSAQTRLQASPDLGITVRRLSPRVAVVSAGPWNNSYLAIATRKGIVVVDSGFSKTIARAVREAIAAEFKRSDFAYLILSHEHSDHVFGNSAYADIPIVGSDLMRAAILRMKADPASVAERLAIPKASLAKMREDALKDPKLAGDPQVARGESFWNVVQADYSAGVDYVPPTITFDRRLALDLGDVSVHLFSFGHWHSAADTIISVPEEGIVRLGAILYGDHLPVLKNPYAKEPFTAAIVDNWMAVLDEVLSQADEKTLFVSCHGWGVMTRAQCAPQVAYLEKLWNEVRRAKSAGMTLPLAKEALPRAQTFPEVANLADADFQMQNIHEHNIEALWSVAP
ncbi:MAG TPA: MBL fold metallo-hydrolase [Vicinamibacteria bacterium]|nr:MBL fold metallo-hydrolase [Vicinamibacteria bacterium]